MIAPLKESKNASTAFIVTDIENWPNGNVLCIDACWRQGDDSPHRRFTGDTRGDCKAASDTAWAEWWEWILYSGRTDKRFRRIYAHNGGGWDWLSFLEWLLESEYRNDCIIDVVPAMSKLVVAKIVVKNRHTIFLCDSLQLLRSDLDSLGKTILGEGKSYKGDLLPHQLFQSQPQLFDTYVRRDTELLLFILERCLALLRDNVAKIDCFAVTIASTALKVFRSMIDEEIEIPLREEERDFLRKGYRGGRVECFRNEVFPRIRVYDVNSLYPFAMRSIDVPVSGRTRWAFSNDTTLPGCYEIEWKQYDRTIPPILMFSGNGCYEGCGVFYTPELHAMARIDPRSKIRVIKGLVFPDMGNPFREYVDKLYRLRQTDKNGPLSLLCKYLLNSLYGKFGQRSTRKTIIVKSKFDGPTEYTDFIRKNRPIELDREKGIWICQSRKFCPFEHVGIAGMITSKARSVLYEGILAAIRNGGRVVYCDTDSVHTTGELPPSMVGDSLGLFKHEFSGSGVYCGKKLYALRDAKGNEKIRAKGVSVGGNNGAVLCYDDMVSIVNGKKIRCHFKQSATLLQVMKGLTKACVIGNMDGTANRTRTLKVT